MTTWFYPGQEDYITKLNELGAIAELVAGQDGWSPTFAVAADGTRSVLQVVDWIGGEGTKPVTGKYVGAAGFVTLIADAVDIRGLKGDKGDEGDAGPANSLNIGTVVSGASASATISGTAPTQELNLVLPKGDNGLNGLNGWSPVLAVATDGERRVLEVVDWIGGEGTKPAITGYIGATGIVVNIADAINVRGPVGAEGDTGPANSLSIGTVTEGVAAATITGTAPSQTLNLVLPKATDGADGTNGDDGWSPIFAVVADGERRVLQLVDWTGGTGIKPATGAYVGTTGLVALMADATDIRGPQGVDGADGAAGPSNVLSIGTVTGGATASATITGTSPSQVLNLVLPKGDPGTNGTDGLATTVAVGTVTTGAPGTSATVVNSGTSSAAVFDFTIPRGDTGAGGGGSGSGDVVGPASATNNGVALFDSTTGKIIKDGGVLGTAAFEAATSFATAAQGTKADTAVQPGSLATVATSGAYVDLSGKPTLGTASALDVPATGNAATGEVVKGTDTRLSDSRTPTGAAGGVLSGSYPNPGFAVDMATQAELDAVSDVANAKLSDAPSDGKTYGRKDGAWSEVVAGGGAIAGPRNWYVSQHTASSTFVVPAGVSVIRPYAFGAGAAGTTANSGGGGGCAYGDIAVTPGATVTLSIASGVAKVTYGGVDLLTANPASGVTGGTASKHASVANGGAYSGGAGAADAGGASSGSPLGAGVAGDSTGGGSGWGGNGSGFGGGGVGGPSTTGLYGADGLPTPSSDPLLQDLTGYGGVTGVIAGSGQPGGGGAAGQGPSGTAVYGGRGGFGAGGGAGFGTSAQGVGGDGGFGGGGGKATGSTSFGGKGGFGGGGGKGTYAVGAGGAAVIRIYY